MSYQGFFINLDRSSDRRDEIERELARVGLFPRYQRIGAIDGRALGARYVLQNQGAVGCFLSHVAALKHPIQYNMHRHIIEDDVIFASRTAAILAQMDERGAMNDYDILYTDIGLPLSVDSLQPFKSLYDQAVTRKADGSIDSVAFRVIDLHDISFVAASSYLVNKNSVAKLAALCDAEINEGIRAPIDDFFRLQAQVGALQIGCVFPFITSVRVEHALDSTIRLQPDVTRRFTAENLARYSFFIDCDWGECQRLVAAHLPPLRHDDRHIKLLERLLVYRLSGGADKNS
jgi:hypothetical protein